jgi:hypothetical protein
VAAKGNNFGRKDGFSNAGDTLTLWRVDWRAPASAYLTLELPVNRPDMVYDVREVGR